MFDIGWAELLVIMVVARVVIGPKELPNAIRTVSLVMRKVRSAARDFQNSLDEIARESGLDDVKREFEGIDHYDPDAALKRMAENDGEKLDIDRELDPASGNSILDEPARATAGEIVPDAQKAAGPTTAAAPSPARPTEDGSSEERTSEPPS